MKEVSYCTIKTANRASHSLALLQNLWLIICSFADFNKTRFRCFFFFRNKTFLVNFFLTFFFFFQVTQSPASFSTSELSSNNCHALKLGIPFEIGKLQSVVQQSGAENIKSVSSLIERRKSR